MIGLDIYMEQNHSEFPLTLQAVTRLEQALGVLDEKVKLRAKEREGLLETLQQAHLQNESLQEATQAVSDRLNAAINRLQVLLEE